MEERVFRVVQYVLFLLLILCCGALFVAVMSGCSSVREAQRLEQMSDAEAEAFAARVALQVATIAEAAVAEEDVSREALAAVAKGLEGLAVGTSAPVAGQLASVLEIDGYGGAILTLTVIELDAELSRRGAYEEDGTLSPRARLVISAVAESLSQVANQE